MSFAELAELQYGYEDFLSVLDFNLERNPGISLLDFYRGLTDEAELEVKEVEYPSKQKSKPMTLKSEKEMFDMVNNKKPKEFNPEGLESVDVLEESDLNQIIKPISLTYCEEEYKGEPLKCRGCLKITIERDTVKCPNCDTEIKWF